MLAARSSLGGRSAIARRHLAVRAAVRHASFKVDNPYSGETYCEVQLSDTAATNAAIDAAAAVQKGWATVPLEERVAALKRFMEEFEKMRDAVSVDISGMMGKPVGQAQGEVNGMYERINKMCELAPSVLADEGLPKEGFVRVIQKVPVGVVLTIAPFNYPLMTAINAIAPALLAGNAVVIKSSQRTPLCGDHMVAAFEAAGLPAGLVQSVHCTHETVDEAIQNEHVGFVAFTGSVSGGSAVYSSVARQRFIDATLELGGKDPGYVAADADAAAAAEGLVDGAFYNAGQSCCGIERVYVHTSNYDAFMARAAELIGEYKMGDPSDPATTIGPLAQPASLPFLQSQVDDAVAKGATLVCGGAAATDEHGKGRFFAPTLLGDCTHDMEVMMEESFGPVLPVMRVESDDEAVALMNDSAYGLTCALFTSDVARARDLSSRINTGTVFMNRCDYLDPDLVWTGVKNTGKGASLSKYGFDGVVQLKNLHFKL